MHGQGHRRRDSLHMVGRYVHSGDIHRYAVGCRGLDIPVRTTARLADDETPVESRWLNHGVTLYERQEGFGGHLPEFIER